MIASPTRGTRSRAKKILREKKKRSPKKKASLALTTRLGKLYKGDCLDALKHVSDNSIDLIFADPPFNLSKEYGGKFRDNLEEAKYLEWTKNWLDLCTKKLKPGGSFFVFHIPKWGIPIADHMRKTLTFRHWISVNLTLSFPLNGRLYPSHYALLYFIKGERPNRFTPSRVPIESCKRCGQETHDYGGHKTKMNPNGVNLRDIWVDIPPVRHRSNKNRTANELNVKLLDRVLDIATKEGDLVLDPFGGSGTTYAVAEIKKRRWVGVELGNCRHICSRMSDLSQDRKNLKKHRTELNQLFTDQMLLTRIRNGLSIHNYRIDEDQIDRVLDLVKRPRLPEIEQ